jgi:hypothetical protein
MARLRLSCVVAAWMAATSAAMTLERRLFVELRSEPEFGTLSRRLAAARARARARHL